MDQYADQPAVAATTGAQAGCAFTAAMLITATAEQQLPPTTPEQQPRPHKWQQGLPGDANSVSLLMALGDG
jgi:hypothetical protein